MPRSYKRTTTRQTWTESQLAAARHEVACGISVLATAVKYGIPRTSLKRRIAFPTMTMSMGPKEAVFTAEQENELVQHLLDLESRFYGLTQKDVQKLGFELAERNFLPHPFNKVKKMAGRDWLLGFLKRNPKLSFRKPEATSYARARGFNKQAVYAFYNLLEQFLKEGRFAPTQIYLMQTRPESAKSLQKKQKIAALKGKKQVGSISSAERGETTSVMMCMSATGKYVPPFMIFPRARMNEALKGGAPAGTKFRCNASGYMTTEVFLDWFDHFLEYAKPSKETPVLLIIDGHSTDTKNLARAEKARNSFVTVLVLPPHCSNKMQPLDVAFMGPFKKNFSYAADAFLRQHPGVVIGLYDVANLMAQAFVKAASISVAISGFKATGIWPCNCHVFSDESFAPSEVTDQPEVQPVENHDEPASCTVEKSVVESTLEDGLIPGDQAVSDMESSFNVTPKEILPLPKISRSAKPKKRLRSHLTHTAKN
ncbi:uncharacterized protein LOC129728139 [Wyeomyia smithii]|uniref:uncharacterized protein LOC129728139 n=1 Tax=Wyeomyia smithii TaxID=174621 RepID=UPI002467C342|nr:uncharacterized protein LOC129728139 [Wyeomyia smithii]